MIYVGIDVAKAKQDFWATEETIFGSSGKTISTSLTREVLNLEFSLTKRNLCQVSDFNSEIWYDTGM